MSVKIGITGHRRLLEPDNIKEEIKKNIREILREKGAKDFDGYSALAAGADVLFAQLVLELNGKLHVVLPFDQKEYEKDFSEKELHKFRELLDKSVDTKIITTQNVSAKEERNKAYLECGKYITDTCEVVITAWDGEKADGLGGTGDIVQYARQKSKEIKIITAFQNDLQKLKDLRDKTAIAFQERYDKKWTTCLMLGMGGATLLAVGIAFNKELSPPAIAIITASQFLLVVLLIITIRQLEKGFLRSNRIRNRREAERLRVIEKLYKGKLEIKRLENNDFISKDVRDIEERYIAETHVSDPALGKEKLMDLIDEQLHYHKVTRPKKNFARWHKLENIQKVLLVAFIAFAAIDVYNGFMGLDEEAHEKFMLPHWLILFFNLIIPPVYAGIEGYIFFKEFRRNLNDSDNMIGFFDHQKKLLAALDPHSSTAKDQLTEMANKIRNKMDEENLSWAYTTDMKRAPGP
jgi:hypothetical protein